MNNNRAIWNRVLEMNGREHTAHATTQDCHWHWRWHTFPPGALLQQQGLCPLRSTCTIPTGRPVCSFLARAFCDQPPLHPLSSGSSDTRRQTTSAPFDLRSSVPGLFAASTGRHGRLLHVCMSSATVRCAGVWSARGAARFGVVDRFC